jgi:metallo-beta-lactamase family protein
MEIQFYGAARTVTGSMHLIKANSKTILLDCGLFQGRRAESYERNKSFPFDASTIDAVVLSHAHTDHAGNLPNLVESGFSGPIYATSATRDLCNVMLYDSAYIQERDIEFVNKKHRRKGEPEVAPLYSVQDVTRTMKQFVGVEYHQLFRVTEGIQCVYSDAGHILGSAVTRLSLDEHGKTFMLGFTGDLGRKNTPILKDPEAMDAVDVLISESTYGGKIHEPISGTKEALLSVIMKALDRHGKLIIPSFSVGRTQELVFMMNELFDAGRLPAIPIFVDSPLALNATEVFRMHSECFDAETLKMLHEHDDPFGFGRLTYIRSVEESKRLNDRTDPCIIIAASGMCEAGRILHHLANNIGDPRNTVLIVGFQAEHTLGRRLVEKNEEVRIFGELYKRKAEVVVLNSLSAHAGQDELVDYVKRVAGSRLKKIFLVHGELPQQEKLSNQLNLSGFREVAVPSRGDRVEFRL